MIARLPYHPQYLAQGLVYDAELTSPLSFGPAAPAPRAPAGTAPAPDSILTARLATTLDSSKTPRGTPFGAVLTEPVFSSDHQLILPEGTTLAGEVTLAKQAQRFHRNGQLRFLFEKVQAPDEQPATLLAALYSVQASGDDHVAVDDEGGTTLTNSKTRFIAPALAILALRASIDQDGHRYADPDGDGTTRTAGSGIGSRGMGGFLGLGLIGAGIGQITRPVGIALSVVGAARTMYTNVLGKGREVSFPADTPIQVQLAPGPTAEAMMRPRVRIALALTLILPAGLVGQQPAFRADTRLVVVHATVRNSRGELVTTLNRDAFTVYENGKRQAITLFRRDDIPVSLGLLIDNSGSMRTVRSKVEAAALALARASNPQDEIFVLNFNDKAHIDVPFTSDGPTRARSRDSARGFHRRHGHARRHRPGADVFERAWHARPQGAARDHRRHRQRQPRNTRAGREAGRPARHRDLRRGTLW